MRTLYSHSWFSCLLLAAFCAAACSAGSDPAAFDEPIAVGNAAEALTLLVKPGSQNFDDTEAGQDIEQLGQYTLFGANGDDSRYGSVHLFKNGVAHRSYQVKVPPYQAHFGRSVALSEHWLAANVGLYPVSANGELKPGVLVVGKDSTGEFTSCGAVNAELLPNCVNCNGNACTLKPGVELLFPAALSQSAGLARLTLELQGNELLVADPELGVIAQLRYENGQWLEGEALHAPTDASGYGTEFALQGNRLAVWVPGLERGYVHIYERADLQAPWLSKWRLYGPGNAAGFGRKLELSDTSLAVADYENLHFIDFAAGPLSDNPNLAITDRCLVSGVTGDVALSGSRALVATGGMPVSFARGSAWSYYGGLPSGIFPRNIDPNTGASSVTSLWGAALDGNRAAIGWRNYRGSNPQSETGAALRFTFDAADCGEPIFPPAGTVQAIPLTLVSASAPSLPGYPALNAVDASTLTRWAHSKVPGTRLTVTLSELQVLSHIQVLWSTGYATSYTVQFGDGSSWSEPQVVPGDGGVDWIDLRNSPTAFGRQLRFTFNAFSSGSSQISIRDIKAFGRVHERCTNPPEVACQLPEHVCLTGCDSGYRRCYCDEQCGEFGDCCSPSGEDKGAQYYAGVAAICGY